jgi:CO dehydrogenase maturation factor
MPKNIKPKKLLICGKGGCGKSTIAALLSAALSKRGRQVFLVDADESNIGLYRMLGLQIPEPLLDSLGGKKGFREKTKTSGSPFGGSPQVFPEHLTVDGLPKKCIVSSKGLKVMAVGKIHHFGEGCACPMGQLFRLLFSSLDFSGQDIVIVDTAAGVEHFGRSLDGQVDHVVCVADPSYESIMMAGRVNVLAMEAGLSVSVILNKLTPDIEADLAASFKEMKIIARLPDQKALFLSTLKGAPLLDIQEPALEALCDAIETL